MPSKRSKARIHWPVISLVLLIAIVYGIFCLFRPIKLTNAVSSNDIATASPAIAWPSVGQSAVGVLGNSTILTHGPQTPVPTASVAKLITALMVLKAKPLSPGQPGPTITITANDVAIYAHYLDEQGSVQPVQLGEKLSEYQALEAMLLPSADNMADTLAIWAYGSLSAYAKAANAFLAAHGLTQTHVGSDASGYDPNTTSTAHDLVMLGERAMRNPVIAGVVGEQSVTGLPLTPIVRNYNGLLGTDGIIGIKTGNTNQAGGVFVSASQATVHDKRVVIITAFAKAPDLSDALQGSLPFIQSTHTNYTEQTVVSAGSVIGYYSLPWGGTAPVVATKNITFTAWKGGQVTTSLNLQPISLTFAHSKITSDVGTITAYQAGVSNPYQSPLKLKYRLPQPSFGWRLTHPFTHI